MAEQVEPDYEGERKRRIKAWDDQLKALGSKNDASQITAIKGLIDAELALAELRIKVRQAGHPIAALWVPVILPTLGAILGAILGGLLKLRP